MLNEFEPDESDGDESDSDSDGADRDLEEEGGVDGEDSHIHLQRPSLQRKTQDDLCWAALMEEIKLESPWVKLKIPMRFSRYIGQLQMGSADQLTCRSYRRYKDDTFFCSDWHIQDHFLTRHCDFGFTYYAPQRTLEIVRGLVEQPYIRSGILGVYRRGLENYSPADCGSRVATA